MLAVQPVGPDRARVELRIVCPQPCRDAGQACCEGLGFFGEVVEDEGAFQVLLRRCFHQGGLEGGEPGAAYGVGAPVRAQEHRGLEGGVGDVDTDDLVRGDDAAVDRLRQAQAVTDAPERPVGVVLHRGDQFTRPAAAGLALPLVLLPGLPQARSRGHVEAPSRRDPLVVMDDRPRLPDPARGAVCLVHHDQVPAAQAGPVCALQRAEPE